MRQYGIDYRMIEAEGIVLKGGIAGSSVTSKTDCLVCGEKAGNKLQKAKELGKIILTPDQFFSLFGPVAEFLI